MADFQRNGISHFEAERIDSSKGKRQSTSECYSSNQSSESKICLFFSKLKYCKYGKNCKFLHNRQPFKQVHSEPMQTFKTKVYFRKANENANNSPYHDRNLEECCSDQISMNKRGICRYFKAGTCHKGGICLFQHSVNNSKTLGPNDFGAVNNKTKKKRVPICHYFKKGYCERGENCKFYHENKLELNESVISNATVDVEDNISNLRTEENEILIAYNVDDGVISDQNNLCATAIPSINNLPRTIGIPRNKMLYDLASITEDEMKNLRDTEMTQLKKRYPKHAFVTEKQSFSFTFEPSDPDWPFDLRHLELEVHFPEKYPIEAFKICVVMSTNNIPEILLGHLNKNVCDWMEKRHEEILASKQVELMFRPFLKWFDKNLEELFICGLRQVKRDVEAKNDGIEFVPVEKLFPPQEENALIDVALENSNEAVNAKEEESQVDSKKEVYENQSVPLSKNCNASEAVALKQGVKVIFTGLEFVEGAAALSCTKLAITLHCIRCKTACNMKCTPGRNSNSKCTKCSKVLECNFVPSVLHQFSNLAGNLHLIEGQVIDINLVESTFLIDCLNCSKQIAIDGLHYGQKQKRWCMFCNEKLIFSIESVKFQAMSSTYVAAKNAPAKKVERKKDALIKEGEPLPDFGTCKHYKKSHRWLRFPCCGRLYPCDVCHDEKEIDHEMKFASRMICGFCSKEQSYSKEKPCFSCSGALVAKAGAHWEGGRGCRNKVKMSRDDKHKYVGTSKTVSRKAQSVKTVKK